MSKGKTRFLYRFAEGILVYFTTDSSGDFISGLHCTPKSIIPFFFFPLANGGGGIDLSLPLWRSAGIRSSVALRRESKRREEREQQSDGGPSYSSLFISPFIAHGSGVVV